MRAPLRISLTLLFTVASCTDSSSKSATSSLDQRVRSLGFDPNGMEDHGAYVVVEGDIRLDKESLLLAPALEENARLTAPSQPSFQYNTTHIVSGTNVGQITVDLSAIEGVSDWAQAARNAIADYNATGTRIQMMEASPGDIIILGAGGKMGPTLARMAARARADSRRVIAVSRWSSAAAERALNDADVETLHCDLLDPDANG